MTDQNERPKMNDRGHDHEIHRLRRRAQELARRKAIETGLPAGDFAMSV
jgi:hypothetical protein